MKIWIGLIPIVLAQAVLAAGSVQHKVGIIVLDLKAPVGYDRAIEGIRETLKQEGFTDANTSVDVEDAAGSAEKASEIVKKLKDAKVDAFVTFSTIVTQAAMKQVPDKPIVFSTIFDPVHVGLIKDWSHSGNNLTGASHFVDIPRFLRRLEQYFPLKRVVVLYTPGEKNTELQLELVRTFGQVSKAAITPIPIKDEQDLSHLADQLKGKADIVYLTGGNFIGRNVARIIEASVQAKAITVTHIEELTQSGVMIGLSANFKDVGVLTGKALVKVLNGTPPNSVPVLYPNPELTLNLKTAKAMKLRLPEGLLQWASKTIE